MTAPLFCTPESVREYMSLEGASTSKYSAATLGSNIRAAGAFLERRTHRYFGDRTAQTLKFTTNGSIFMALPGFRSVSSVTRAGATLTEDESFWLVPDAQQTGVYTGIQFRGFQQGPGSWWLHSPEWFDRGLDFAPPGGGNGETSLPNDLIVTGDLGYEDDGDFPEEMRHATKILASYFTKRPDALLSGAMGTPEGSMFDLSNLPIEVQSFIADWRIDQWVHPT